MKDFLYKFFKERSLLLAILTGLEIILSIVCILSFVYSDTLSYSDSEIFKYIKMWDNHDIYMMFHNTYNVLKQSRSISYDIDLGLISLLFLITLKPIPSLEVI